MKLEPWHVGNVVADVNAAIRDHVRLGTTAWTPVALLDLATFDALTERVVSEELLVAFGSTSRGLCFELIAPVHPDGDGPQARLLGQRGGPSHVAYWSHDVVRDASELLDGGAELVLAPLACADGWEALWESGGPKALLSISTTCYLRLRSGSIVELNSAGGRAGMASMWGASVEAIVPQFSIGDDPSVTPLRGPG